MTEMRYELAIERIENIKGENTVSEKYRKMVSIISSQLKN